MIVTTIPEVLYITELGVSTKSVLLPDGLRTTA